jgi:hypothetical protein
LQADFEKLGLNSTLVDEIPNFQARNLLDFIRKKTRSSYDLSLAVGTVAATL